MKAKQIVILLIILSVLAALVLWKNSKPSPVVRHEESSPLNLKFDPAALSEVTIQKQESKIVLSREDNVWRLPGLWGAKADQAKVSQLLDVLLNLRGEFRSDRPDLLPDYEISDDRALEIALRENGKAAAQIFVGLKRPGHRAIFIRKGDSHAVYFSQDNLLANIGFYGDLQRESPKQDYWVDFRLLGLDPDQVVSVSLYQSKSGKENTVFEIKKETAEESAVPAWRLKGAAEPFLADEEKVKEYLRKFQFERAKEILDPEMPHGLETPDFRIVIGFHGGEPAVILFKKSAPKEADYIASVSGEREVKLVGGPTAESFQVTPDFFKSEQIGRKDSPDF